MRNRRVVVTGMGAISPIGNDLKSTWENAANGKSGIGLITKFDTSNYAVKIAGEVKNPNFEEHVSRKELERMDDFMRYGVFAGVMAIKDSGILQFPLLDKKRVGLIIGSGIGGLPAIENTHDLIRENKPNRVSPFFIPKAIVNMIAGNLSISMGFEGPNYSVISACATSNHAIGDAMRYIEYGDCDIMITGGAEACICETGIAGFTAAKTLSKNNSSPSSASRPFDLARDGFVMSEGSGILVLEEYEHAKRRGAKIYAELCGYAANSDAYHLTAPKPDGSSSAYCMQLALQNASLAKEQIDYVNAHATSTSLGDIAETIALKQAFGQHAYNLSISATKSMTGHMLGATGAIEAILTILSIENQIALPTINLLNADPQCDLDYTPNEARKKKIQYALSNSFGFGGTNSTLIFAKI